MFVCVCMCVCVDGRANSFPTSTALVCQSSACCKRQTTHTHTIVGSQATPFARFSTLCTTHTFRQFPTSHFDVHSAFL